MAINLIRNPDERNDPPRPLLEHLTALRDMLVFAAVSWACCVLVVAIFSPQVLALLKSPAAANQEMLQGLEMLTPFKIFLSISGWGGTALAFPFLVFSILRFVFPALTNREKLIILSVLVFGTGLFTGGVFLAYRQTLPLVVNAFVAFGKWMEIDQTIISLDSYIPVILKLILAFGLVFQIPLALFLLGLFGLVTSKGLREKRRFAIVFAFVLAMFLTPPDPMSQLLMAIPLCLLYEVSIWAIWLKERFS